MSDNKYGVNLLSGPIDSSLRKFALPLVFSFLVTMIYSWVDMFYASRISSLAVAAIGVSEQLLFFAFSFGIGFAVGTSILVARRYGEGNMSEANRTASQGMILMWIVSIGIALMLYLTYPLILDLMNIKGETNQLAKQYLSVVIIGLPFNFLTFQINAMVRSVGNSIFPMAVLILSNILNAIISPILIFGFGPIPRMEVFGAGLGTSIAQILGYAIALALVLTNKTQIRLSFKGNLINKVIVGKITKLGIPASIQLLLISLNRIILSALTYAFGPAVLTTYMLGLRMDLFVFMPIFAIGVAIEITTGQNLGANDPDRVFKYFWSAVKQTSLLMVVFGVLVFVGGHIFAGIFTKDAVIINEVSNYLKINAFSYVFFAIGIISIRVLSGAGDYNRSLLVVALILFFFQLPVAWILSNLTSLKHSGIWYGILVSQISFAAYGYYQLSGKKWLKVKV